MAILDPKSVDAFRRRGYLPAMPLLREDEVNGMRTRLETFEAAGIADGADRAIQ